MDYKLVFDITQTQPNWNGPAFGLPFVAIGTILVLLGKKGLIKRRRFFPYFYLGFALIWTTCAYWGVYSNYYDDLSAIEHGTNKVVEGTIENFHPMPASGHDVESFTVGGKFFSFSGYGGTPGFHHCQAFGGPLRQGLRVRISYVGDDIVKLEISP